VALGPDQISAMSPSCDRLIYKPATQQPPCPKPERTNPAPSRKVWEPVPVPLSEELADVGRVLGGILVLGFVLLVVWFFFFRADNQREYIELKSKRLQREAEEQRARDALELQIRLKALEEDMKKNPHLYK